MYTAGRLLFGTEGGNIMRKLSSYTFSLTVIFILLLSQPATATQDQEEQSAPARWVGAVMYVETTILQDLETLASNKKWGPAMTLLDVYREIGSNSNAAIAIGKMLIKKNRDGAVTVIQLARQELINPFDGPIQSTRQVKRVLVSGIISAPKQESKQAVMTVFLKIFTLEGMTPSERTSVEELKKVIDEGLLKTAAILEKVLAVIIEEVGNFSPLDERPGASTAMEMPALFNEKEYEE